MTDFLTTGKMTLKPKNRREWTADQDATLVALRNEDVPYRIISKRLKKTVSSCRSHYHEIVTQQRNVPMATFALSEGSWSQELPSRTPDESPDPPNQEDYKFKSWINPRTVQTAYRQHAADFWNALSQRHFHGMNLSGRDLEITFLRSRKHLYASRTAIQSERRGLAIASLLNAEDEEDDRDTIVVSVGCRQ